jgi:HlyD family secretion protein
MRTLLAIILVIVLAAAGGGWYWRQGTRPETVFRTIPVQRGDLVSTISATGTLEPEEVIDVGAQVAGLIMEFGKDSNGSPIDYRSPVEPDMVLARIDDTVYKADVDTAVAQMGQAKTAVQKGQADLDQANAKLMQAQHNWERAKVMGPSDALSQNDYEMYHADYETAKANVALAQAEIAQAVNGISLAEAEVAKAKRNFEFCTIKSPVKGVIIDRRVNIGQTVVSSLNAPSLFLIAKDLTRMQIWVAVNEADVGKIKPGTPVTFTCDTFPDETFQGVVNKVRLNATMTQNVVMYTVEVRADNPRGILLPYLSAKVQFEVGRESDTLLVPNSALRWYPTVAEQVSPAARAAWKPIEDASSAPNADQDQKSGSGGGGGGKRHKQHAGPTTKPKDRPGVVWVKDGELVRPVDVKVAMTDGVSSAISSDELKEGSTVVIGETTPQAAAAADASRNPFLPNFRRR